MTVVESSTQRFDRITSTEVLGDLLAHRRWVRRRYPFDHVLAQNVFQKEFYEQLHQQVVDIVQDGSALGRNMGSYDASGSHLDNHRDGPLGIFVSRAWHDMLAGMWGVDATGDVSAGLHHHEPGSRSGFPHSDLNCCWFPGPEPAETEVRLTNDTLVDQKFGRRGRDDVEAIERMRAIAVLFYLGNPEWQPGDGGETGLFESFSGAYGPPGAAVPPVNNSMVTFEVTPFTWHRFLTNRKPRTSVTMWLHTHKDDVIERWGEQSIVEWE